MDRHVLSVRPKVVANKQEGGDSQASSIKSPERVERVPGLESSVSPGKGKGTQKGTLKFWSQEPGKRG